MFGPLRLARGRSCSRFPPLGWISQSVLESHLALECTGRVLPGRAALLQGETLAELERIKTIQMASAVVAQFMLADDGSRVVTESAA